MNKLIKDLADKCWDHRVQGRLIDGQLHFDYEKFAEMIALECAAACGSQADKKNIRKMFGLPVESNVQYEGPDAHGSITSQYTREYNLPRDTKKD